MEDAALVAGTRSWQGSCPEQTAAPSGLPLNFQARNTTWLVLESRSGFGLMVSLRFTWRLAEAMYRNMDTAASPHGNTYRVLRPLPTRRSCPSRANPTSCCRASSSEMPHSRARDPRVTAPRSRAIRRAVSRRRASRTRSSSGFGGAAATTATGRFVVSLRLQLEVLWSNPPTAVKDHRLLEHGFELADIPWPRVTSRRATACGAIPSTAKP